ncbi:ACP S-malonyltransferase [Xiamenia xianingshaonis]|nr:ACP S-malonyltransferase [Xiamenia xianingshaonis]
MSATVLMFSGQGSQKPGMGLDLLDVPEVAEAFEAASDVLGFDAAAFLETVDQTTLNDTRHAQPMLACVSMGLGRALVARGLQPKAVLGFSLGQVSALAVSGMLSLEDAMRFVQRRSVAMAQAAEAHPGAMSALLKADPESAAALCAACAEGEVLVPANFNAPGQIVISGASEAVARAEAAWAAAGKRSSRLATSGAFHSPLMAEAAEEVAAFLETVDFAEPAIPLIDNVSAAPLASADARRALVDHLTHPVRFDESVSALIADGATEFVEVGSGNVLVNLVKRIDKGVARTAVTDRASFEAFCARLDAAASSASAPTDNLA